MTAAIERSSRSLRRSSHDAHTPGPLRPHRSRPHRRPSRDDARAPLGEADLVAVADLQAAAAERLGESLGVEWSTDPQSLIDDPRVEAVAITCASTAHADLVVAAAEAGKAVFVEKPMAMTLADADRAIAACRAAGVPLQVGFNRRFARDFATARETVAAGGIGPPQLLRSLPRRVLRGAGGCGPVRHRPARTPRGSGHVVTGRVSFHVGRAPGRPMVKRTSPVRIVLLAPVPA